MTDPIIFNRQDCLSPEDALYWKDILYRTVKIGTELEYACPKGKNKQDILSYIEKKLVPSSDLNELGPYGVLDVASEHCGLEIRIIGRQPYYRILLEQYRFILSLMIKLGVRARSTCGLHFHILTVGLSEPVPEIILANLWNLVRRYAPHLKFLTSTGKQRDSLCRRRNHNSHLEMIKLTPGAMSMQEIQKHLKTSRTVPEHQNFFNLEHVAFTADGQVKNFHVEFRFPDSDLSPTAIVTKTFLFLAMLMKAVEISQFGVIHAGKIQEWRRKIELLNLLNNNDGMLAASDTSQVTDEIINELGEGNQELLHLLKPIFSRFEMNPCFEILSFLAKTPISLMRVQGYSWEKIEDKLQHLGQVESINDDKINNKLIRCLELSLITGAPSIYEWKKLVGLECNLTPKVLENRLESLNRWRGIWWDASLGTISFLS